MSGAEGVNKTQKTKRTKITLSNDSQENEGASHTGGGLIFFCHFMPGRGCHWPRDDDSEGDAKRAGNISPGGAQENELPTLFISDILHVVSHCVLYPAQT